MKQRQLAASLFITTILLAPSALACKPTALLMPCPCSTPYNWTGYYAGLNAGVVKQTMNVTDVDATTFNATLQQATNPKFTGGFQFGYRRQLTPCQTSGVYGFEFSSNFSNATFSKQYGSPFALYRLNATYELKNVSLLQVIGGIAADRVLFFLSAGVSWVDISGSSTNLATIPFFKSFNVGKNVLGSTLGGGLEYAYDDATSFRFKLDVITPNVYSTHDDIGDTFQISNNIVQATLGVNFNLDKIPGFRCLGLF